MTNFPTRLTSLDSSAPLGLGELHVRAAGPGQGSSSLARLTAVDLSRLLPTVLVAEPGLSEEEHVSLLAPLVGPDGAPGLEVLVSGGLDEALTFLDQLEEVHGSPCALVLESLPTLGLQDLYEVTHTLLGRCQRGSLVVAHSRVSRARTAQDVLGRTPAVLMHSAHSVSTLHRPHPGRLDVHVAKSRRGGAGELVELGFEHGLITEIEPHTSMELSFLMSFARGRSLVESALEGTDLETTSVLRTDWAGTLEDLVATTTELSPELKKTA
jgi:hypothetical protein